MFQEPSKIQKHNHRRNLPHIHPQANPVFITSRCLVTDLPVQARDQIMEHCLYEHQRKVLLHCAIVMPDHLHLIFAARTDPHGDRYSLAEIMNGIKGAAAHSVNKLLGRKGSLWQDESFDHILRTEAQLLEKILYVAENPIRAGICQQIAEYFWFWASHGQSPSNYIPREQRDRPR